MCLNLNLILSWQISQSRKGIFLTIKAPYQTMGYYIHTVCSVTVSVKEKTVQRIVLEDECFREIFWLYTDVLLCFYTSYSVFCASDWWEWYNAGIPVWIRWGKSNLNTTYNIQSVYLILFIRLWLANSTSLRSNNILFFCYRWWNKIFQTLNTAFYLKIGQNVA